MLVINSLYLSQFHTEMLHLWGITLENKCTFWLNNIQPLKGYGALRLICIVMRTLMTVDWWRWLASATRQPITRNEFMILNYPLMPDGRLAVPVCLQPVLDRGSMMVSNDWRLMWGASISLALMADNWYRIQGRYWCWCSLPCYLIAQRGWYIVTIYGKHYTLGRFIVFCCQFLFRVTSLALEQSKAFSSSSDENTMKFLT